VAAPGKDCRRFRFGTLNLSDQDLFETLCVAIALLVSCYALYGLSRLLSRGRDGFSIGRPLAVAFAVRLLAAVALGQVALGRELRGGDELTFLARAKDLADQPLGGADVFDAFISQLHTFIFSMHYRVLEAAPPDLLLRIEMITFAVVGIGLLSAAVYELAGARASRIAIWILALEPANIFFSSLLHKEPLMYLAEGLVAYGGAVLWKRGKLTALFPMILGCLIATATRPYVGWFLTAAAAAVVLHASLTRQRGLRSFALTTTCVVLIFAFIPVVLEQSSDEKLEGLQASQDANATGGFRLSLERVDYSTREKLIINLPNRIKDVIVRPYVWQTENTSQQLGAIGTLIVLACLALLAMAIARNRKQIMNMAGPLVYPAGFMLVAYAISAGNAGTAYRYRTHLVGLALALVLVLLAQRRQEQEGPARVPARPGLGPVDRTRTAT
jgi:hypothetical protein